MIQLLSSCNHSQQVFSQMALKLMAMLAIVFLVFLDIIIFIVIFTHQINARFPMLKRITLLTYTLMIQLGLSVGSYSYQPLYLGVPTRVSFYTKLCPRQCSNIWRGRALLVAMSHFIQIAMYHCNQVYSHVPTHTPNSCNTLLLHGVE